MGNALLILVVVLCLYFFSASEWLSRRGSIEMPCYITLPYITWWVLSAFRSPGRSPNSDNGTTVMMNDIYRERFPKVLSRHSLNVSKCCLFLVSTTNFKLNVVISFVWKLLRSIHVMCYKGGGADGREIGTVRWVGFVVGFWWFGIGWRSKIRAGSSG